ncbi:tetratricopeptide repeat protein [Maribacter sp. R77961]|uniref:tetratricopeptide repeat protein n=1 Tax=Maribacter sp. R77961 TaxID=3093871 RepID=UPI0037CB575D
MKIKAFEFQKIFKIVVYVLTTILLFFTALDGLSSAIDFLTVEIGIYSTIVILVLMIVLYFLPAFNWKNDSGSVFKVKKIGKRPYISLLSVLGAIWIVLMYKSYSGPKMQTKYNPPGVVLKPIFNQNDTSSFNVLILRFEDYIAGKETYCIGRAISENLNDIKTFDGFNLDVQYVADSINPPQSFNEAKEIQKRHNADLIIYGLAKNVENNCEGADVCFRYNIGLNITDQIDTLINVNKNKHDLEFVRVVPERMDNNLSLDVSTLGNWIKSLCAVKTGNSKKVLFELDNIVSNDELSPKQRSLRLADIGFSYMKIGKNNLAKTAFEKSLLLDSLNHSSIYGISNLYGNERQFGEAQELLLNYIVKIKEDSIKSKFYQALGNIEMKRNIFPNVVLARQLFRESITLDPSNKMAHMDLGILEYRMGNEIMGSISYEEALKIDSALKPIVYSNLGGYYSRILNFKQSLRFHDLAVGLNPNDYLTYISRQILFVKMQEYDKAINDLDIAISIDPDNFLAYYQCGHIFKKKGDYKQAIIEFEKAVELDIKNPLPLMNIGESYMNEGMLNNAIVSLLEAKKLDTRKEWIRIYHLLYDAYLKLGKREKAFNILDEIITLKPNVVGNYLKKAYLYFLERDYIEEDRCLMQARYIEDDLSYLNSQINIYKSNRRENFPWDPNNDYYNSNNFRIKL